MEKALLYCLFTIYKTKHLISMIEISCVNFINSRIFSLLKVFVIDYYYLEKVWQILIFSHIIKCCIKRKSKKFQIMLRMSMLEIILFKTIIFQVFYSFIALGGKVLKWMWCSQFQKISWFQIRTHFTQISHFISTI